VRTEAWQTPITAHRRAVAGGGAGSGRDEADGDTASAGYGG
jgi:hypothetical protein